MKRKTSFLLLGVLLFLVLGLLVFYWVNGTSFSMASMWTRSDSSQSKSDVLPFEEVNELGTGSLPLRSQHAVALWEDQPLTVFTDENYIYVSDLEGNRTQVMLLGPGAGGPTLAAHDGLAVIAWVTPEAILSTSSTDLMEWSDPVVVGVREQKGGPIPSIDWTGSEFAVVWVDAPPTNEVTGGMDGVGALQLARGDGVSSWSVESINQTTAIVSISGSTLVWRDDRSETGSRLDTIRMQDIYEGEEEVICSGYDPAVAVEGENIAIGYHLGAEAHLRTSLDGGETWTDTVLDPTGKFVSPLAFDGVFGAVWVDYPDAEAANDARNDAGHRTSAMWASENYFMNEGEAYTLQGQGTVIEGTPLAVYQVDGVIFLAQ